MIFGTALGSKIFNIEKFCNEEFGEEKARQLIKKTGPKKLLFVVKMRIPYLCQSKLGTT